MAIAMTTTTTTTTTTNSGVKRRARKHTMPLLLLGIGGLSCSVHVFLQSSPSQLPWNGAAAAAGAAAPKKTNVVQLSLEEFRSGPLKTKSTLQQNQTMATDNRSNNNNKNIHANHDPDAAEPFPIVITPYNGSVDPFYNIPSDGTNLWDDDPRIPAWVKAYLNWHKWRRQTWNPHHWAEDRWMILQCLQGQDRRCGGTADRLKPLPTLLRIAYQHHRMLLIRWTKPAMLETYLVPPNGGVDWRVPDWLADVLANQTHGRCFLPGKIIRKYARTNLTLMRTRYQSNIAGKDVYNDARHDDDEPVFEEAFAPLWRLFFRPSPTVAQMIQSHLDSNGLVPGHYVAAHLRALYGIDERPLPMIRRWTGNAVNCASQLRPGAPIFFASDSSDATARAQTYAAEQHGRLVVHTPHPNPPLHLDQDPNSGDRNHPHQNYVPSDYYDTFVDLYLIALAGCVTFNKGGYGQWGLLIGGNLPCHLNHGFHPCSWHTGTSSTAAAAAAAAGPHGGITTTTTTGDGGLALLPAASSRAASPPLFLDPMP